jgi:hypothetical protein
MVRRRNSVLAALRRQRDRLGRFVVALFAVASMTITGAPCFAMAVELATPQVDEAAQSNRSHDAHAHEHAVDHGDHGSVDQDNHAQRSPAHCPHCPMSTTPGHAMPSAHSFCSAFDDFSDQASVGSQPPLVKHVLLIATYEPQRTLILRPPPTPLTRVTMPNHSAVALNVRHCVFLI